MNRLLGGIAAKIEETNIFLLLMVRKKKVSSQIIFFWEQMVSPMSLKQKVEIGKILIPIQKQNLKLFESGQKMRRPIQMELSLLLFVLSKII